MTYQDTITYLYNSTPLFQNIGQGAYKEGLSNTHALDEHFDHPHRKFRTIHVAGTNGKGSCSHTMAAVLQEAGYKVGLYTSPHLVDFRERIRVNGVPVGEQFVIDFVGRHRTFFEPLHPSFFELTTAMALHYFAEQGVDVAVIEVGLGGRLDCTNIISPDLTVITNISFDHVGLLGNTLAKIAHEKAGIIKPHTPIIIGEHTEETRPVFEADAAAKEAPITFAQDMPLYIKKESHADYDLYHGTPYGELHAELRGYCQEKNVNTLLHAIAALQQIGYSIGNEAVHEGFRSVCRLTGLMGRWQQLSSSPRLVCDTGHNIGGFQYLVPQIMAQPCRQLRIVFGMVNDKDINAVLALLPQHATYYFTQASVARALPSHELQVLAAKHGLGGTAYPTVAEAIKAALGEADREDFIYVGGSSFVVADLLSHWPPHKTYGLIGYPLGHSFSKDYFTEHFHQQHIDAEYKNFELPTIDGIHQMLAEETTLQGFNVTIPYKQQIMPYLDEIDTAAAIIGAVNVVKVTRHPDRLSLKGHNTDAIGFADSIRPLLRPHHTQALILGTGGASKAVDYALRQLGLSTRFVSRRKAEGLLTYEQLTPELLASHTVIVNTTPLGMHPHTDTCPPIDYSQLGKQHLLFDVVYNPEKTLFLQRGEQAGATICNGMEMLIGQAKAAWEIWNRK